mgnify:CR=1 FL=1
MGLVRKIGFFHLDSAHYGLSLNDWDGCGYDDGGGERGGCDAPGPEFGNDYCGVGLEDLTDSLNGDGGVMMSVGVDGCVAMWPLILVVYQHMMIDYWVPRPVMDDAGYNINWTLMTQTTVIGVIGGPMTGQTVTMILLTNSPNL